MATHSYSQTDIIKRSRVRALEHMKDNINHTMDSTKRWTIGGLMVVILTGAFLVYTLDAKVTPMILAALSVFGVGMLFINNETERRLAILELDIEILRTELDINDPQVRTHPQPHHN